MEQPKFSQKALEKLSSPERLDILFAPTTPLGWVALFSLLLLAASGLIWSIFGVLTETVTGVGLIVNSSGIANITNNTNKNAVISSLRVDVGQKVKKGDLVAVLYDFNDEIDLARLRSEADPSTRSDVKTRDAQIHSTQKKIALTTNIISPYNGIVIETKAIPGDIIQAGHSLFSVELEEPGSDLIAVIYVPALDGKKVKPGMISRINVGSVDSSEYGQLVGRVVNVSKFPISGSSMSRWTGNKELSDSILAQNQNSVVEIKVNLIKDKENITGYMWSTIISPPKDSVTPGAVCTANIVFKRQSPLEKAFLYTSQWMKGY